MNRPTFHERLIDMIEDELSGVGCFLTWARRRQMLDLLGCLDRVETRREADNLFAQLGECLQHTSDEHDPPSCDPAVWMGTAECA